MFKVPDVCKVVHIWSGIVAGRAASGAVWSGVSAEQAGMNAERAASRAVWSWVSAG